MPTTTSTYGTWSSPIDAEDTISKMVGFAEIHPDGDDLFWTELRPAEGGRQVLVRRDAAGQIADLTPDPINVRTRVHEYGGGAVLVSKGVAFYSEFSDQRLYRLVPGTSASSITPEPPRPMSVRYADGVQLADGRLVYVEEDHPESGEATNRLVMIHSDGTGQREVVAEGRDFYSTPSVSPDGTRLAWLQWDHPNMPWDGTELVVASFEYGKAGVPYRVAGGSSESVFQPGWEGDGTLVFATDSTGWWNLYRWDGVSTSMILQKEAEFGLPQWIFGRTSYGILSGRRILAAYWEGGEHKLGVVGRDGSLDVLPLDYSYYAGLKTDGQSRAWFTGYQANGPSALIELDVDSEDTAIVRSNPDLIPDGYKSVPQIISYPTGEDDVAHAIYYPPANPDFAGPEGEKPPLIVEVHGGPTSNVFPAHGVGYAYWTSRGFGVVDVNYRGSTGYGRAYREKLNGEWGVVDVEDCLAAAGYLAYAGLVDRDRMVITGGSAGGYTTLAALAFGDSFSAGASYYGVADVELLAKDTHKFESRYMDTLVGTSSELMRERSPLHSADQISVPVILFQGLEDRVVPPEQAEAIAAALEDNGVPYAHVTYEAEDHGFRDAKNIVHSLESELAFYGRVFGFRPAGDIPDVEMVGM